MAGNPIGWSRAAVGGAFGLASGTVRTVGWAGRRLSSLLVPGRGGPTRTATARPGAQAGIESMEERRDAPPEGAVRIECIDYGPDRIEQRWVEDLDALLAEPRAPDWAAVRWINVDGLHPNVVDRFRSAVGFHTLAAEDVMHVPQRPRIEPYPDHLFLVMRMLMLADHEGEAPHLVSEQVSMFLYDRLLLTFQERQGDVWNPIRQRLRREGSRIRNHGADHLLYALLDATVDHAFPILEHYGDLLEQTELRMLERPEPALIETVHTAKRDLLVLRRVMWPTRQLVDDLRRDESGRVSATTETYLSDVHEHNVQIIDILETYRELAGGLNDLYLSMVSHRMNEVMKVLTVIATVFIPITFLAGVYGMNFEHIPELSWRWAYPTFWGICITVTAGLLWLFRRKGWLGGG